MNISELKYIKHGSEDSIDKDIYVLCPKPLEHSESLAVVEHFDKLGFNSNPIYIEDGIVKWNFKGVNDEVQNSIYSTYHLHEQITDNPISSTVDRLTGLKTLRTIRGVLSQCSRTQYRDILKPAIKNPNVVEKIKVMEKLSLSSIEDFEKISKIEAGKFFAFQFGQTLALMEDNIDLFTKKSVSQKYPDLHDFLYRKEDADWSILDKYLVQFTKACKKAFKYENNLSVYTNLHTEQIEFYDTKKECLTKMENIQTNQASLKPQR